MSDGQNLIPLICRPQLSARPQSEVCIGKVAMGILMSTRRCELGKTWLFTAKTRPCSEQALVRECRQALEGEKFHEFEAA